MELPSQIKNLYCHWDHHTGGVHETREKSSILIPDELKWFIHERLDIWKKKTDSEAPPYTTDPILSKYRFCNIFREFDRQTIEFHTLLNPIRDNFPLWLLNMFYCRMVARTSTIKQVGLLSFDEKINAIRLQKLLNSPRPRFGTPYVFPISVIQKSSTPTRELFITSYLPKIISAIANEIQTWKKMSVYDGVARILPLFGFNLHFLWTEVLIDVAYQYPEHIDLFARFPVGPGALPTFRRLAPHQDPSLLASELACIPLDTNITINGKPLRLSAENWEGIGCEFRKYTNLKQGKGRKRVYQKE